MASSFGKNIIITLFGESQGPVVGITIDGLPAGVLVGETSDFEILAGLFNGKTTGAPLTAIMRNGESSEEEFLQRYPRPGHADYPSYIKRAGFNDYRDGGHISEKLLPPLVFAGSVLKQVMYRRYGIKFETYVDSIHGETRPSKFDEVVKAARKRGDSIGGAVLCRVSGIPVGWGEPYFESIESVVSQMVFSVPGVCGIEFGDGFELAGLYGSEAADELRYEYGDTKPSTNHNGGVSGGLANGNDLVFRVAIRPTPTTSSERNTVDLQTLQNISRVFTKEYDPCAAMSAASAVDAAAAIALSRFLTPADYI